LNFWLSVLEAGGKRVRAQTKRKNADRSSAVKENKVSQKNVMYALDGEIPSSYSVLSCNKLMSTPRTPQICLSISCPESSGRIASGMIDDSPVL